MDPVSAVSLAAAIVGFVDFSWKLLSTAHTISTSASGMTAEHEDLNNITDNIIRLDNDLTAVTGVGAIPDSLRVLSGSCKEIAEELRNILHTLQFKHGDKRFKSFMQAMRHVYKKDQVESLAQRLDRVRAEMHLQISSVLFTETSRIKQILSALVAENERLAINDAQQLESQMKSVHQAIDMVRLEVQNSKHAVLEAILKIESPESNISPILPTASGCMQELSQKLSSLAVDINVAASNHQVLSSLWFPIAEQRKANVAVAHEKTFSWMFSPDSPSQFEPWLRRQSGVYWIMGKAGSGKSTLMKFLLNHPKTSQLLRVWAGGQELVVTNFFLWRAGAALQKSQEGLYRSLLFEILHQCPDLIQSVCASKLRAFRPYENNLTAWTLSELSQALKEVQYRSGTRARFCFFIDGLDEYDGEAEQMVEILENLANWEMVKICASSRPWNEFIDAFGCPNSPQLALEALTQHDIKLYVQDRLEQNTHFKALSSRDARCQELVLEVVQKARGVFLWVELVIRSLITGLKNADRTSDLQKRLRDFPPTLEEYFSKMLESIDPTYRQQTAETFKFALKAREPLSLTTYSILDEEDPDEAPSSQTTMWTKAELLERHEIMKKRLNGRSKGLLEVAGVDEERSTKVADLFFKPTVDFLHRSAHDFLLTRDLQLMLRDSVRPDFNPNLRFVRALCVQAQRLPRGSHREKIFEDIAYYAFQLEKESCYDHFPLLDQLLPRGASRPAFLSYCAHAPLYQYVTNVMERQGLVSRSARDWALGSLLDPQAPSKTSHFDRKMVSILVEHGASPNAFYGSFTVWEHFLMNLNKGDLQATNREVPAVLVILLSGGAIPLLQVAVGQRTVRSKLTGRAADLHKQNGVRTEYKSARQIAIDQFGEEQAQSLYRAGMTRTHKPVSRTSLKSLWRIFPFGGTKR